MPTRPHVIYRIKQQAGYVIRDAPIDPDKLPEPVPQDREALATLLAQIFPEHPQIAQEARESGPMAFKLLGSVKEAQDAFNIDRITAHRLIAQLKIGEFLYAPPSNSLPLIRSIEDVYKQCFKLAQSNQEQLVVLLVNNRYQLVHEQVVAMGDGAGLYTNVAAPVQVALERKINTFILVHNHPSGDPTPSTSDIEYSEKLQKAASMFDIELLDHVIVAENGYASALRPEK